MIPNLPQTPDATSAVVPRFGSEADKLSSLPTPLGHFGVFIATDMPHTRFDPRYCPYRTGTVGGTVGPLRATFFDKATLAEEIGASFAALRSDPEAWADEQRERRELDGTLSDDIAASE